MKKEITDEVSNALLEYTCIQRQMPVTTIATVAKEARAYWAQLGEVAVRATLATPAIKTLMEDAVKYRKLNKK